MFVHFFFRYAELILKIFFSVKYYINKLSIYIAYTFSQVHSSMAHAEYFKTF